MNTMNTMTTKTMVAAAALIAALGLTEDASAQPSINEWLEGMDTEEYFDSEEAFYPYDEPFDFDTTLPVQEPEVEVVASQPSSGGSGFWNNVFNTLQAADYATQIGSQIANTKADIDLANRELDIQSALAGLKP